MKRPAWIISLALAAWCSWITPALAESPTEYVRGILDRVMAIQTDPALAGPAHQPQRRHQIREIIKGSFDFPWMANYSLGSAKVRVSEGQRREFTETFRYLFTDSYTRMVLDFLFQEKISYNGESRQDSQVRVDTAMLRPNETIQVSYLLHQVHGRWLLYDVLIDGVSILNNYRLQFAHTIRSKSFEALLELMNKQRQAVE